MESNTSNSEHRAALLAKFTEALDFSDWAEQTNLFINVDGADANSARMKVWRRFPEPSTAICLKMEYCIPNLTVEQVVEIAQNMEARAQWDRRFENVEMLEKFPEEKCGIFFTTTPKPPVPMVSARDLLLKYHNIVNEHASINVA